MYFEPILTKWWHLAFSFLNITLLNTYGCSNLQSNDRFGYWFKHECFYPCAHDFIYIFFFLPFSLGMTTNKATNSLSFTPPSSCWYIPWWTSSLFSTGRSSNRPELVLNKLIWQKMDWQAISQKFYFFMNHLLNKLVNPLRSLRNWYLVMGVLSMVDKTIKPFKIYDLSENV